MTLPRLLQTLLTVIPALTAGLYFLGLPYHQGYLSAFGLDDSLFPLTNDKALFTGFFSLVIIAFSTGAYAAGAIGMFALLVTLAVILSSTARIRRIVDFIKSKFPKRQAAPMPSVAEGLLDRSATVYGYFFGVIVSLLLLVVMADFAAKSGREQGVKDTVGYSKGEGSRAKVFTSQFPNEIVGKLVMCGAQYCAFWSDGETVVLRHESIDRIVTHNPSLKNLPAVKPMSAP